MYFSSVCMLVHCKSACQNKKHFIMLVLFDKLVNYSTIQYNNDQFMKNKLRILLGLFFKVQYVSHNDK